MNLVHLVQILELLESRVNPLQFVKRFTNDNEKEHLYKETRKKIISIL